MNATIATTTVTQTANEILGTEERKLYYLIIKNEREEKMTINVGQKTHDAVIVLLQENQAKLLVEEPFNQTLENLKQKAKKGGL